jgi:hypothetical protein
MTNTSLFPIVETHSIMEQLPEGMHILGEPILPNDLFKYWPFNTIEEVLKNKELVFLYPGLWENPLEKIYLETDYSALGFKQTKIYSLSFIAGDDNEDTEWKMYASNYRKTVRCQVNTELLLEILSAFAAKNNLQVYAGNVNYEYSKEEIQTLHLTKGKHYDRFFKDFTLEKYLQLLLLKPKTLYWQNELRIFLVPKSHKQYFRDKLKVSISEAQYPLLFSKFTIQPFEVKPSTIPSSMEFDMFGHKLEKMNMAEKIQALYPNAIIENYIENEKCRAIRKVAVKK